MAVPVQTDVRRYTTLFFDFELYISVCLVPHLSVITQTVDLRCLHTKEQVLRLGQVVSKQIGFAEV